VRATPLLWITRVLWLTLPLTLGELLADAVAERSSPVRLAVAALAWGTWVAGLAASFVALPAALTVLRILTPVPLVAGAVAATQVDPSGLGWAGIGIAAAVAVVSMSAEVGAWFVDGASYGDERRVPLRPPAVLVLGPVELAWVAIVVPVVTGVLLLAARSWVAGAVLTAVGLGTAWWGGRVLHRLSRRCIVFVPTGMTLVDDLALAEPILFPRRSVTRFGPAPADAAPGGPLDLTVGATGLILRIDLDPPVSLVPSVRRGGTAEAVDATSVLVAPARPGRILAEAEDRRIRVSRA
jgi:hypothetical protein